MHSGAYHFSGQRPGALGCKGVGETESGREEWEGGVGGRRERRVRREDGEESEEGGWRGRSGKE